MFRIALLSVVLFLSMNCLAGDLPFKYEELTTPQLAGAREKSGNTIIIPIGILEKHGPHMPLGTDLLDARETVIRAVKREYSILFQPEEDSVILDQVSRLRKTETEGHTCEIETSMIMAHRPDLAHTELGKKQSGEDQKRLEGIPHAYTGIWWYARFPNHYAGDGSQADPEIGNLLIDSEAGQLAELIGVLKKDNRILGLQERFYRESENPSNTPQ